MKIFGHRGKRDKNSPYENTLEVFKQVLDEGADGVEIDVICSKDSVLYIIHDEDIAKHSDFDHGDITNLNSSEIDKKYIGKKDHNGGKKYKIPKLSDLLEILNKDYPDKILNIEIKQKKIADKVFKLVEKQNFDKDNLIISSFNHDDLQRYRELDHKVKIGILFESNEDKTYIPYLKNLASKMGNVAIHPPINSDILPQIFNEFPNLDKNIWTVSPKDMQKLQNIVNDLKPTICNIFVDNYLNFKST